jgi:simple sugar transport system ATP-binding protein
MTAGIAVPALLAIRGVRKAFGATQALGGIDLDIAPGRIVALMGANGAGKSTLVNILSGLFPADAGTIRLDDAPFAPASPRAAAAAGIATVHQATQSVGAPGLSVADTLLLDRFADRAAPWFVSRRSVRRQAAEIAAQAGFALPLDRDFGEIGPADRQMVAIARAVSSRARVLILDEPTASLSAHEAARLFAVLEELKGRGLAILYISHRTADLARLADRAVVLRGGQVVADLRRPIDFDVALAAMIGRPVAAAHALARAAAGGAVLELSGIRLHRHAPDIDLTLARGEIVSITGSLGAGKSRLLATIGGAEPLRSGRMRLEGVAFAPRSPAEAIAAGVVLAGPDRHRSSFLPSDWPGGSVAGTIALPHLRRWFPHGFLVGDRERRAAEAGIARLGIRAAGPDARLDTLSGGNQQKVVLARWQAEPARVLLLDEPFQGVDVGARADIIAALRADRSTATLIATSDPEEALEVADRIFAMDQSSGLTPWRAAADEVAA